MPRDRSSSNVRVVVLGGHDREAIGHVIGEIPVAPGFAVIVAAPDATLAQVLKPGAQLPIVEVKGRTRIEPDRIFVVPADREVTLQRGDLLVGDAPAGPPAVLDRLLRSVADDIGQTATGVILAGRGSDGALGIKRLKEAGGLAIAQKPDGENTEMPRAAIATGFVDLVLPLDAISPRLIALGKPDDLDGDVDQPQGPQVLADTLRDILMLVRVRSGHDFAQYKRATLYRRIARRVQVCECETIAAYHLYLRDHPDEIAHLLRDLLISVTSFFRDPEVFAALARDVIPKLFAAKAPGEALRVWVAGCASGEEAYSIGMLLLEHAATRPSPCPLQIFATDIDDAAVTEARNALYPESIEVDVSPERLQRFFTRETNQYRVAKELRELVLFSPHNLLRDPPFSRLDLVSCRNLLIYLNRDAQNRVLTIFHFGLRPDGVLLLGTSESAENAAMFAPLDPKQRLFVRRPVTLPLVDALPSAGRLPLPPPLPPASPHAQQRNMGELHYQIVERYAPPSILVNSELEVVHLSEHAGTFLQLAGGEPTRDLLRLVHPALRVDVRTAIHAARQLHGLDSRVVRFDDNGTARAIEIRVRAVDVPELGGASLLVMFDELEPEPIAPAGPPNVPIEPKIRDLENELQRTRDRLRTTIEQYETSVEELKASNEELHAINEELRSASEELETGKEEAQSVNEELTTLNHELAVKVEELGRASSDVRNLMMSTDIAVVFLDRDLRITRFTPRILDLFNLIASDIGRPLSDLTHRLDTSEVPAIAATVLQTLRSVERDVRTHEGRRYLARWLPYRSLEDRIEGVVITFIDVTDLRDAVDARRKIEDALLDARERLEMTLHSAAIAIFTFDARLQINWAHVAGHELTADERDRLAMFAPAETARLHTAAKQAITKRTGTRLELDMQIDGAARTFEFRLEPTAAGVAAVGFDLARLRSP